MEVLLMINLKITMIDGSEMLIKNSVANSAMEFINLVFKPYAVTMNWVRIIKGTVININNVRSVVEISEAELTKPEDLIEDDIVILPGEKENEEITPEGEVIEDMVEKVIEEPAQVA
jgi:hypothetical protein